MSSAAPVAVRPGEADPAAPVGDAEPAAPVSVVSGPPSRATVVPAAARTTVTAAAASRARPLRRGGAGTTGPVGAEPRGPGAPGPRRSPGAPGDGAAPPGVGEDGAAPGTCGPGAGWAAWGGPKPGGTAGTLRSVSVRHGVSAPSRRGAVGRSGTSAPATARSSAQACPASGRCSGRLSISRSSTGPRGPARRGCGSGSETIAVRVENVEVRRKGEAPSTAAYRVAPSAHTSEAGPGSAPWARSGAR